MGAVLRRRFFSICIACFRKAGTFRSPPQCCKVLSCTWCFPWLRAATGADVTFCSAGFRQAERSPLAVVLLPLASFARMVQVGYAVVFFMWLFLQPSALDFCMCLHSLN
jgi:hypothetical protein